MAWLEGKGLRMTYRAARMVLEEPRKLVKFLQSIRNFGILKAADKIRTSIATRQHVLDQINRPKLDFGGHAYILTTKHCHYIALLLQKSLHEAGIASSILYSPPADGYRDAVYFVICPQVFHRLPGRYIAYQMEQSVSSRWFTSKYISTLRKSIATLDYSKRNIAYLQTRGLSYQSLYYLPVSYLPGLVTASDSKSCDVVFYGDVKNARRRKILTELAQRFSVRVVNEVFGEELHQILATAKIVINIHYYENALLETTRIYECLSLGTLVVSEKSSDMDEHGELDGIVQFVDCGDVPAMSAAIEHWLGNEELRIAHIASYQDKLALHATRFNRYFFRFLLAQGLLDFFQYQALSHLAQEPIGPKVCLSLPETVARTASFVSNGVSDFQLYTGLRSTMGWVGCGLSYKSIAFKAKAQKLPYVIVCEDDVQFPLGFETRLVDILEFLEGRMDDWDIFSGLISDLSRDAKVLAIQEHGEERFVYLDRLVGAVFNIYNASMYDRMLSWSEHNLDMAKNTFDRFIDSEGGIRVITTVPFLVGHRENVTSTLWGFENTQYSDLIEASTNLLRDKVIAFKNAAD